MTALTGAVIVGFRSTRDTHTSLDQSNAEQIITTYVTKDIQAADTVVVPPTTPCGGEPAALETATRSDPIASPASPTSPSLRARMATELVRAGIGQRRRQTIADDVTSFTATGSGHRRDNGRDGGRAPRCIRVQFSFEVRRRQA